MTLSKTTLAILVGGISAAATFQAQAIQLNFQSITASGPVTDAKVAFAGNSTLSFPDSTNNFDFVIGSVDNGFGNATGLKGKIDATFTIGAVSGGTGIGSFAPVTGTGTFSIFDGTQSLTGQLTFAFVTRNVGNLGFNVADPDVDFNLNSIVYTGGNADLNLLKTGGKAVVSLVVSTGKTIQTVKAPPAFSLGYGGFAFNAAEAVPDGGSTVALLGMALAGMEGLRRRMAARKA